jgi:hypothetical protein
MQFRPVAIVAIGSCLFAAGCDNVTSSPKMIEADGQTYIACKDLVWVSIEGGGLLGGGETYKITFTDAAGLSHTLRGIKKVEMTDVPGMVPAPMPRNPTMTSSDGKPVVEGNVYTWSDGSKARLHNGAWEAVRVPNDVCRAIR